MNRILLVQIVLTLGAAALWGYGYRTENQALTLAAIVVLVVALLLRFARPKPPSRDDVP